MPNTRTRRNHTTGCLTALALLILLATTADAQHIRRLSQGWEFVREDLGSVWEALRPAAPGSPESVPLWDSVTLPHCFNALDAVDPDVNYYQGPGWYRTLLSIDQPYPRGRILLHFEGAGQRTRVYIYTREAGSHTGGYDEWTVDITDEVQAFLHGQDSAKYAGKVPLVIRCDNSRDVETIPSRMSDFTVYGGLYRDVDLEYMPALSLARVHILPRIDAEGREGTVDISAAFLRSGPPLPAQLSLQIRDPQGRVVKEWSKQVQPWEGMKSFFSLTLRHPQRWSPADPALYGVDLRLKSDRGTQQWRGSFGFRHAAFREHGPFLLNGQRLLLRGTHRHQDGAGVGAAETADMVRREFLLIKAMGVNFIRLAHYQQSRLVLHLCDSLGILVWEEIPWCRGGLGGASYQAQAKDMLSHMIDQHYNHPSVIIWGLGNEIDWPGDFPDYSKDSIRAFLTVLNDLAHALDSSRKTAIRRCDFCKDIVDVYSPSIWAGWYSGRYTEYRSSSEKQMRRVPRFFHAEWGADSHAGRHAEDPYRHLGGIPTGKGVAEKTGDASLSGGQARASRDGDWSETYQCDLIDWYLKEQEQMPWLSGSAYWIFKDFATPLRPDNPIPYVNEKGVVTRDLHPKEGYYVFQSYWTTKPMVRIYGHDWPLRWGKDGKTELVKVYSNCPEVELFVNGVSAGRRKRDPEDFPAAGLRWKLPVREGDYLLKAVGRKGGTQVTDSIRFHFQATAWGAAAKLSLRQLSTRSDTVLAEATLLDAAGVRCLDADQVVRFSVAGAGKLIDDLGTPDGSRKIQLANGRARIRVKVSGVCSIGVVSEGMAAAILPFDTPGDSHP